MGRHFDAEQQESDGTPMTPLPTASEDVVVLPAATRDFILKALGEARTALRGTHGLRATRHILVEEGTLLTRDNSFRINHVNPLLLMSLIERMLAQSARPAVPPRLSQEQSAASA
jgi:hypothetical protein